MCNGSSFIRPSFSHSVITRFGPRPISGCKFVEVYISLKLLLCTCGHNYCAVWRISMSILSLAAASDAGLRRSSSLACCVGRLFRRVNDSRYAHGLTDSSTRLCRWSERLSLLILNGRSAGVGWLVNTGKPFASPHNNNGDVVETHTNRKFACF